jgi:hypothetical protein
MVGRWRNAAYKIAAGMTHCHMIAASRCYAITMSDVDDWQFVRSWIERQVPGEIADYVRRGRPLAATEFVVLRRHWIAQMELWSNKTAGAEDHKLREDIQAEMRIRGYAPPFEVVRDDLVRLAAMSRAFAEGLSPLERRRFNRKVELNSQALRESVKRAAEG